MNYINSKILTWFTESRSNKIDMFYAGSSPLKEKCIKYILPHFDTFHMYTY